MSSFLSSSFLLLNPIFFLSLSPVFPSHVPYLISFSECTSLCFWVDDVIIPPHPTYTILTATTTSCSWRSRHFLHFGSRDDADFQLPARLFRARQSRSFQRRIRITRISIRLEGRRSAEELTQDAYNGRVGENALQIGAGSRRKRVIGIQILS